MSHPLDLGGQPPVAPERVPASAWALALSSLTAQLLQLGQVGVRPEGPGMVLSMVIGALLVGWVSFGVLTGRTVRLVLAWVLLVLALLGDAIAALEAVDDGADTVLGWPGADLVTSAVAVASLARFTTSRYLAWQRTRPQAPGPSLAPLVAVAALVGLLGGVVTTPQTGAEVQVRL